MKLVNILLACVFLTSLNCEASIIRINPDDTYTVGPDGGLFTYPTKNSHKITSEKMYVAFEEVDSNEDAFHHIDEAETQSFRTGRKPRSIKFSVALFSVFRHKVNCFSRFCHTPAME